MQFVGAWNYETMEFREYYSVIKKIINDNSIMRNLDYQNTQNYFNLGCDFIVTSKTLRFGYKESF